MIYFEVKHRQVQSGKTYTKTEITQQTVKVTKIN